MQTYFQHWLAPEETGLVVESCGVDFVRDASSRSLLQYTLHLREPVTDTVTLQVVTGVVYDSDRGDTVWQRLQKTASGATVPVHGHALPAWTYLPELQTLFQVYPFDVRLPALAGMLHEPPPTLRTAVLSEFGEGSWELTRWEAETVRYRVDMRAMVRLDVRARRAGSEGTDSRRLYAKLYRERAEGKDAFTLQRALWERSQGDNPPLSVARPVAYLPEHRTLLLAEALGRRLLQILRDEEVPLSSVAQAARAVAALHQLPLDDVLATRQRVARDDRSRLATLAASFADDGPEIESHVREIVAAIAAGLGEAPVAPTHFDLKPGHILLDGDRVTLLDFDKLAPADPLVDVTNLVASLGKARGGGRDRSGQAHELPRAFIAEYFAHVPAAWYATFPARYAMALLADASTSGRGQRGRAEKAGRASRAATLIQQAHAAVTQQVW
jgi:hypothetical protein